MFLGFSLVIVIILPGYLLSAWFIWPRRRRIEVFEGICTIFAMGLTAHAVLAAIAFTCGLTLVIALGLGAGVCIAAAAVLVHRQVFPVLILELESRGIRVLAMVVLAMMAVALAVIIWIGWHQPLDYEEMIVPTVARKILESRGLAIDQVFLVPDIRLSFIWDAYPFLVAALAKVSGLEPVQVFVGLRPMLVVLVIAATYVVARQGYASRPGVAWVAAGIAVATVWSGWGGQYSSGAFSPMMPLPVYQDFSLSAVLPVWFALFLGGLNGDRRVLGLAVALMGALAVIHSREVVVATMLAGGGCLGAVTVRAWRPARRATLVIVAGMLVLAALAWASQGVLHMNAAKINAGGKAMALELLMSLLSHPWSLFFPPTRSSLLQSGVENLWGHPILLTAVCALPVMILADREVGARVIAGGMVAGLLVGLVPGLGLAAVAATYFALMTGAPASLGIVVPAYAMFGRLLWMLVEFASYGQLRISGRGVAAGGLVLCALVWGSRLAAEWDWMVYLWLVSGVGAALALGARITPAGPLAAPSRFAGGVLVIVVLIFTWYPAVSGAIGGARPKSLWTLALDAKGQTRSWSWPAWYSVSAMEAVLPWAVITEMRAILPPGAVVAAPISSCRHLPYEVLLIIPAFIPAYVYAPGYWGNGAAAELFVEYAAARGDPDPYLMAEDDGFRRRLLEEDGLWDTWAGIPRAYQIALTVGHFYQRYICERDPAMIMGTDSDLGQWLVRRYKVDYLLIPPQWRAEHEKRHGHVKGREIDGFLLAPMDGRRTSDGPSPMSRD